MITATEVNKAACISAQSEWLEAEMKVQSLTEMKWDSREFLLL